MLNQERLNKVFSFLEEQSIEQMLVSDPVAIFYLTGKWFYPGERFLGLLIQKNNCPILYLNELFRTDENLGINIISITDTTDICSVISTDVKQNLALGVDKELPAKFLLPLMNAHVASNFVNTSIAIDEARSIKDEYEIALMIESSKINDLAIAKFKGLIHEGVSEIEVASQCLDIYKSLGAESYSFDPIVAFGVNSADPHHGPDETILKEGDTVLFDVGCKYKNYCSDMTRTFFYKKELTAEQKRVYNLVRSANEEAEAICKPGVVFSDIDKTARDIITNGGYGKDFTHRLGHYIGIQDHDYGDVSANNFSKTKPGNIFSIEPGIYNKDVLGVRIEDLVLITETGHIVLNAYPKEIEIIE